MNTRLQVEHPVTEMVTGLDLVELQLRVALGEPLGLAQDEVELSGHSIEVRLYAEDPARGYLPQPGPYAAWVPPARIRVDHGLSEHGTISAYYDPMVAKLIATGPDRNTARRMLLRALEETVFFGGLTNRDLLGRILADPEFAAGAVHTRWLDGRPELAMETEIDPRTPVLVAALWLTHPELSHGSTSGFRLAHHQPQPVVLDLNGERVEAEVSPQRGTTTVTVGETSHQVTILSGNGPHRRVRIDDELHAFQEYAEADCLHVRAFGSTLQVRAWDPSPKVDDAAGSGSAVMPMDGTVLSIDVSVGDAVAEGDVLARVEAMKLETALRAGVAGTVAEIRVAAGSSASVGTVLVLVEPLEPSGDPS
jgi:acetyl/propionyl-CoA carboxylase alpha subunit